MGKRLGRWTAAALMVLAAVVGGAWWAQDPCGFDSYRPGAGDPHVVIRDDFERSSINVARSAVCGERHALRILLTPRVTPSQFHAGDVRWLEPSARIDAVAGLAPRFELQRMYAHESGGSDWAWHPKRRPMYSFDRERWHYFDHMELDRKRRVATFWNDAPFDADVVYVSRSRQVSVSLAGQWLERLAKRYPGIVTPAPSALALEPSAGMSRYPAQEFIAGEHKPQTDELGRRVPATPLYAARISDPSLQPAKGGRKGLAVVSAGVHAGEDIGDWFMRAFITHLLSGSEDARAMLSRTDVLVLPLVNGPGRTGGHYRAQFEVGQGGADDINRNFHTEGVLHAVDVARAVLRLDLGDQVPDWTIDFHSTGRYRFGFVQDADDPYHTAFKAHMERIAGIELVDEGNTLGGHVSGFMKKLGVKLHLTYEVGDVSPMRDEEIGDNQAAMLKAVRKVLDEPPTRAPVAVSAR